MTGSPGTAGWVPDGVVVVGAGVVGLTVATVLAEAGHRTAVIAADPPLATTSRVAGAIWDSYLCAGPHVFEWAAASYHALAALAEDPATGVALRPLHVVARHPLAAPSWVQVAGGPGPLPAGLPRWVTGGFSCPVPTVDTGCYLPWLARRLAGAGVHVERRRLDRLAEAGPARVVVNCAGLGARELAADATVRPVRGQVVVLANPGLGESYLDWTEGAEPTYAIAHSSTVVAGGCAVYDDESLTPDPALSAAILSRVTALVPALAGAEVLGTRVGLRPWRPEVRVEEDPAPPPGVGRLIHCYGHGGAGVTLSWGSAQAAARLVGPAG